jgi:DNA topoisomerase-2
MMLSIGKSRILRRRWCFGERFQCPAASTEVIYERKTPIEHVLLRPGMYIGQTDIVPLDTWVYNALSNRMERKELRISPALLKLFDEIMVNAADNYQRDKSMTMINVHVLKLNDNGLRISIENNGSAIPIELHAKEHIYIPELIFGHLLTGSNFNDATSRLTGGSHGYGAKLTNIFSKSFSVDICDKKRRLRYQQTWENNMNSASLPEISKSNEKYRDSYTKITFEPDLARFSIDSSRSDATEILNNMIDVFYRRCVDIAGCIGGDVSVSFNSIQIPVRSFKDYVDLFAAQAQPIGVPNEASPGSDDTVIVHSGLFNKHWEVAAMLLPITGFSNMSFVNSVWTTRGGTHVSIVTNQICKAVGEVLTKKGLTASLGVIKNRLMIFVNCRVENPFFEGQTKDVLISKPASFGDDVVLPRSFLNRFVKTSGIVESISRDISYYAITEANRLLDVTTKTSKKRIGVEVPKLEDALWAGSADKALDCTLILTEGDSAKALAVAGLEIVGRESYGVMPLRGKV